MRKIIILVQIAMFGISCNNRSIKNPEKYFGTADTIGIGITDNLTFDGRTDFFSAPSDTTLFATLINTRKGYKFKPSRFKQYFNPISDTLATPYCMFRVLEYDSTWIKIVFNEKNHQTCYIKRVHTINNIDYFQTWENYFLGKMQIMFGEHKGEWSNMLQPLVVLTGDATPYDTINGNTIPFYRDHYNEFLTLEVQGEWMRVKPADKADIEECWIKWRNGSQILVIIEQLAKID